jgi:hypothetical protein
VDDWVSHDAPLLGTYSISQIYASDELGTRGRPGARYLKWKLNNLGYRGPDLRPGGLRIMCIGSSETFGLYEEENGEYPRRLEIELNRRFGHDAVQVVNVAYPGMSISATVRRLPEILRTVQPRIATVYPSVATYVDLPALRPPRRNTVPSQPKPNFELRMQTRLETLAKQWIPESVQTRVRAWQTERASRSIVVHDRVPEKNVMRFKSDLTSLVEALQAEGIQTVLMTHATRFGDRIRPEERDMLVAWRKFYPMLKEEGFLDMEQRMNNVIRQVAAEHNLLLIDTAGKMPSGPEYFAEFVHFTDRGAQRMADIIAGALLPVIETKLPETHRHKFVRVDAAGRIPASPPDRLSERFLQADDVR